MFAKLGLDVDAQSFAKGQLAVEAVKLGLQTLVRAASAAVGAVVDLAKSTVDYASELDDTSQAIGVNTTALQELRYAAAISGLGVEELNMGLTLLARTMHEAVKGGGEQAAAFKAAGVSLKDASGKVRSSEEVLGDLAERFATLPDGAEKTALAMQFFGRSGARMVPLLNQGRAGMAALRQEAHELGVVMDDGLVKRGAELGDTWDRLVELLAGLKRAIGAAILPQLIAVGGAVTAWVKANRDLLKLRLQQLLRGVVVVVTALGKAFAFAWRVMRLFHDNAKAVGYMLGFGAFIVGMVRAAQFVDALRLAQLKAAAVAIATAARTALAWAVAAAPFVAIGVAIGALLLVLDDLRVYQKGGRSLFGLWADWFAKWWTSERSGGDPWWLTAIKALTHALVALADGTLLQDAVDGWKLILDEFSNWVRNVWFEKLLLPGQAGELQRDLLKRFYGVDTRTASGGGGMSMPPVEGGMSLPRAEYRTAPGGGMSTMPSNHFSAQISVQASPGMSVQDVGAEVQSRMEQFYESRLEEANASLSR